MTRRPRKAAAAVGPTNDTSSTTPLARPDDGATSTSTGVKAKTLYEIAAERQAQLHPHAPDLSSSSPTAEKVKYVKISPDGSVQETTAIGGIQDEAAESEAMPPIVDTLLLASSLSALHFTLDVLTVHQYAQELRFPPIIQNTLLVALPTLTFAIHLLHGHLFPPTFHHLPRNILHACKMVQQAVFLLVANGAGCYLIYLTNDKGYYAVMKQAPSIGTFWVWCIVELGLAGALAGVAGPGMYAWYHDYGIF